MNEFFYDEKIVLNYYVVNLMKYDFFDIRKKN